MNVLWSEKLHVWKKQIHKDINFISLFPTKIQVLQPRNSFFQLFKSLSQDDNWWTGPEWCGLWCVYQLFGLILTAPIHCRGSSGEQVMKCLISPNLFWWRNKLIYILDGLRVSNFKANFRFWVKYSFTFFFSKPRRFDGAKRSKMLLRDVTFSKGKHFMWRNKFMKRVLLIRKLQQRCKWNLKNSMYKILSTDFNSIV